MVYLRDLLDPRHLKRTVLEEPRFYTMGWIVAFTAEQEAGGALTDERHSILNGFEVKPLRY
jgi:hypothetical protein